MPADLVEVRDLRLFAASILGSTALCHGYSDRLLHLFLMTIYSVIADENAQYLVLLLALAERVSRTRACNRKRKI